MVTDEVIQGCLMKGGKLESGGSTMKLREDQYPVVQEGARVNSYVGEPKQHFQIYRPIFLRVIEYMQSVMHITEPSISVHRKIPPHSRFRTNSILKLICETFWNGLKIGRRKLGLYHGGSSWERMEIHNEDENSIYLDTWIRSKIMIQYSI